MSFENILSIEYLGNTVQDYLIALGIALGGLLLISLLKKIIAKRIKQAVSKSESKLDDLLVKDIEDFVLPIVTFLFIYWGINYLTLSEKFSRVVDIAISVIITFFVLRFISSTIKVILSSYIQKQENGETKLKQIDGMMIMLNIIIWILGSVFLIDNLGYNVNTILAGVGIGGVAVALAAQNIVGDLFNYFVIFFDKPFEVGDAINVDDKNGTIEYIGVKTTRLRSLTGEQIIIANSDLTKSRVHNFKRQENRRVQFTVTVTYHTSTELLSEIPNLIKAIIEAAESTKFDRAHFARFTEYGLVFEIVYYVTVADYLKYMDIQQAINLQIIKVFKEHHINFLIREDKPGEWDNPPAEAKPQ
ncbi:MAG TPA: mechanosensitive ion channel family protein [Cyclobacteriaceae bacterium]